MRIKKFNNFINEARSPFDIIKDLIRNDKMVDGETYTLVSNDINIVRYLIEHGLDVNLNKGLPLLSAAKSGNKELVDLLINFGADIHIDNNKIFKAVCKLGENDMIEHLISKLDHHDVEFYNSLKSFVTSSENISGESKTKTLSLIDSLSKKNC